MAIVMVKRYILALLICAALRLLGPVRPGVYGYWSWSAQRARMKLSLWNSLRIGHLTRIQFMRMAGVHFLGRNGPGFHAKMYNLIPELTFVGLESTWGMGSYSTCVNNLPGGVVVIEDTAFPEGIILGNRAVLTPGSYPTDLLVGVSTYVGRGRLRRQMQARRDPARIVFGAPAETTVRKLPNSSAAKPDPTFVEFLFSILLNDLASFAVQALAFTTMFRGSSLMHAMSQPRLLGQQLGAAGAVLDMILSTYATLLLILLLTFAMAVALKWLVLGKAEEGIFGRWSGMPFRYFFPWKLWLLLAPHINLLKGTVLMNMIVRSMGGRIGPRTLLLGVSQRDSFPFDSDLLDIGADAVLSRVHWQLHTFEDDVLKTNKTTIGDNTVVGSCSCIMRGAHVSPGVQIYPRSCVMVMEHLPGHGTYAGVPVKELLS